MWAGACAIAGAIIAHNWLRDPYAAALLRRDYLPGPDDVKTVVPFVLLGFAVFGVALTGAFFFTQRKAHREGQQLWSPAARRLFVSMAVPLVAGGAFVLAFLWYGTGICVAPGCLLFYGLALVSAGKHTLTEVVYLGYAQILLGIINLAFPGYGLYFWAAGFGVLHIIYGLLMWRNNPGPKR